MGRTVVLVLLVAGNAYYGIRAFQGHSSSVTLRHSGGAPEFVPIEGTSMQYATNTTHTILRIGSQYYLWLDGVWFQGQSASGPYSRSEGPPSE